MKFNIITKNLLRNRFTQKTITPNTWPKDITFDTKITKRIKDIEKYTNSDREKEQGAVGWEYAFSVLQVLDDFFISPLKKGDYNHVQVVHNYRLTPQYRKNNEQFQFVATFDTREYKTGWYDTKKVRDSIHHGLAVTFHSHPKYYHAKGQFQYTFFSSQDIAAVVNGSTLAQGLVAGNHVWLAGKTDTSSMVPGELLREATQLEFQESNEAVETFVSKTMRDFGIVFYSGRVGGRLKRL